MTKTTSGGFDLADLSAVAASDQGFEFEVTIGGEPRGVWLKVLGAQASVVQTASNKSLNDRRRKDIQREVSAASAMKGADNFSPVEADIEFGQNLAAVRLVGWRGPGDTEGLTPEEAARFKGINQPYSPELALKLIQSNADISNQVLTKSNDLGNFMKLSSPAS